MSKPFVFKQFTVEQDKCAMKIGTDAVILGSWVNLENNPNSILDIGAGTGVLALMLAQRSNAALIDAIEIDVKAYEQCVDNFENSLWNDRLFCYHASLEEFTEEIEDKYDLVISNPPFYSEDYKSQNKRRDLARFKDALPFENLLKSVSKLLAENGTFCAVVPFKDEIDFLVLSKEHGLFPNKILHLKGTPEANIKRSFIELSRVETAITINELIVETSRHNYTKDYIELTKDFYLKM